MKFKKLDRKGFGIEELIGWVFYVIVGFLVVLAFSIYGRLQTKEVFSKIEAQQTALSAHKSLREFADLHYDDIVQAYKTANYEGLNKIASGFFHDKLYIKTQKEWKLDILDSKGVKRGTYLIGSAAAFHIITEVDLVLHMPLQRYPENEFITLRLQVGRGDITTYAAT